MKIISKNLLKSVLLIILSLQLAFFINANTKTTQTTTKDTVIIVVNSQIQSFNPAISNAEPDQFVLSSTFRSLFIPVTTTNDICSEPFITTKEIPYLVSWYNKSADSLTWFINLHAGLKWQDGYPLNTSDVKFAVDSILNQSTNSPLNAQFTNMFSGSSWSSTDLATIQAHATQIFNSTMMKIQFGQFDPYQLDNLGMIFPLPKHQLQFIPLGSWTTDGTNTGATALTGNGPYVYSNISSDKNNVYLDANPLWDALYASKFSNVPYNEVPTIPHVIITVNSDPTASVTSLKAGQVDFIDSQMGLAPVFSQITSPAISVSIPGFGMQEMGLNQRSPIWGFNPLDPATNYGETTNYGFISTLGPPATLASDPHAFMSQLQYELVNDTTGTAALAPGQTTYNSDMFYYQTLNATQRLWIRQAIDFSIARQAIIDSTLSGHGYLLVDRILPQTGLVNNSLVPRAYNLTIASDLLTKAFGYNYYAAGGYDAYNTGWVDESLPYFKMTLFAPNNNAYRIQWENRIGTALTTIGINVTTTTLTFPQALNRIFYNPVQGPDKMGGVDSAHSGFDAYFSAWGGSVVPYEFQYYSSLAFAPQGNNYQFLNSSYMDNLMKIEVSSNNPQARIDAYEAQQQFVYQNALVSMINEPQDIYALSQSLQGFNPFDGYTPKLENWTFGSSQSSYTYTTPSTCSTPPNSPPQNNSSPTTPTTTQTTTPAPTISPSNSVNSVQNSFKATVNNSSSFADLYTILGAIGSGSAIVYFTRKRKIKE